MREARRKSAPRQVAEASPGTSENLPLARAGRRPRPVPGLAPHLPALVLAASSEALASLYFITSESGRTFRFFSMGARQSAAI